MRAESEYHMHLETKKAAGRFADMLMGVAMGLMFSIIAADRHKAVIIGAVLALFAGLMKAVIWFSKTSDHQTGSSQNRPLPPVPLPTAHN